MGELDPRKKDDLLTAFEAADNVLLKKYIEKLDNAAIVPLPDPIAKIADTGKEEDETRQIGSNISLYHVDKIVFDKEENIQDKLTTIYTAIIPSLQCSILMLMCGKSDSVDLYFGIVDRNISEDGSIIPKERDDVGNTFESVLLGNFPGTKLGRIAQGKLNGENEKCVNQVLNEAFKQDCIASVSLIPAPRNDSQLKNEAFVQGLEKLIDSMRGKRYTALFLADPVDSGKIDEICASYEELYSQLSPFKASVQNINCSSGETDTTSYIEGVSESTGKSLTEIVTDGTTESTFSSNTFGGGASYFLSLDYHHTKGKNSGTSHSEGTQTGTNEQTTTSRQDSVAKAVTSTNGESLQLTYESRTVKTLLDRIDEQIKRLRSCQDFGMFNSCAYFLSDDYSTAVGAASVYRSLIRGVNSSVEASAVNVWNDEADVNEIKGYLIRGYHPRFFTSAVYNTALHQDMDNLVNAASKKDTNESSKETSQLTDKEKEEFIKELLEISKPEDLPKKYENINTKIVEKFIEKRDRSSQYMYITTPAMMVSGKELAYQLAWPKKSVAGLPVVKCAAFGRNIMTLDGDHSGDLEIGKIYHMHHIENTPVCLDSDELCSHVFITGSTGSGKSNTVYELLAQLVDSRKQSKQKKTFLVIEPAKGEYKNVFGNRDDVSVYGTHPDYTELLRINPFSFPERIHIYEHLDRLVEIFNVCWPMYAAMPAVLKDSIERAYVAAGWNLKTSKNKYGKRLFPTFIDVVQQIEIVMNESQYSSDSKGDYKGALSTRLKSLTIGINSLLLTANEISPKKLFDENVIIDLSRVGSTETKSLIMGILVMKLQEYRMSQGAMNSDLRHVTVLEEAHNLLKRTSTEQTTEGANLLGKSVEMLTNAIAEMRTYGESFVIVDQAPGLLDLAAIRNTNTKIILRLPEYSDRELVGRAAGLNDEQIDELSRLKKGVAAIYQNGWLEAALCQIDEFKPKKGQQTAEPELYQKPEPATAGLPAQEELSSNLLEALAHNDFRAIEHLDKFILTADFPASLKCSVIDFCRSPESEKQDKIAAIAYEFFNSKEVLEKATGCTTIDGWKNIVVQYIRPSISALESQYITQIISLIAFEQSVRDLEFRQAFERYSDEFIEKGWIK